jgi:xanthine dehydrogenase YagR molybdenum-binding subunit
MSQVQGQIGAPLDRVDGPKKVTGEARYAYEYPVERVAYAHVVQSTVAKGRITAIDTSAADALPGVIEILTHQNARRLLPADGPEFPILQSDRVSYRGELVALVIAESLEIAREAAELVRIAYEEEPYNVELRTSGGQLLTPRGMPDFSEGDVDRAMRGAPASVDQTYATPAEHNNPLEPHAVTAIWGDDGVTVYDANQGSHLTQDIVAEAFGLEPESLHVIAPYVGGGFGSKGLLHQGLVILAVMASEAVGQPVKLAITRQQMFAMVGYRTPTIQRVRLAADREGHLTAVEHNVVEQTSTTRAFVEPTAAQTLMMYPSPNRRITYRVAVLDLPPNFAMRAPGRCPGMFGLESAMDELAVACGLDPVELRIRNEPDVDPESGLPFSSRGLVECLQKGTERFGWEGRDPTPGASRVGRWFVGSGVAASTYPYHLNQSTALIRVDPAGDYHVAIDAVDIGTGAWTVLTQIAAESLGVPIERVFIEIGDSRLPRASIAGSSMGTASWGTAIVSAARNLRERLDEVDLVIPPEGLEAWGEVGQNPNLQRFAMHSFGAQFAEVRVNVDTGEVRVPRLVGVFAAGRMMNAKTARSQLLGGMTMGLSMALHEESVLDPRFGDYVNHDLAEYHIATNADVGEIDVSWIDEDDPYVNPLGAKGIGELGITGTAAAIANAVYHATGVRVRDLPITLDKLLPGIMTL